MKRLLIFFIGILFYFIINNRNGFYIGAGNGDDSGSGGQEFIPIEGGGGACDDEDDDGAGCWPPTPTPAPVPNATDHEGGHEGGTQLTPTSDFPQADGQDGIQLTPIGDDPTVEGSGDENDPHDSDTADTQLETRVDKYGNVYTGIFMPHQPFMRNRYRLNDLSGNATIKLRDGRGTIRGKFKDGKLVGKGTRMIRGSVITGTFDEAWRPHGECTIDFGGSIRPGQKGNSWGTMRGTFNHGEFNHGYMFDNGWGDRGWSYHGDPHFFKDMGITGGISMSLNGSFTPLSWRFADTHQSQINLPYLMLEDGKMEVGKFTKYRGQVSPFIRRLVKGLRFKGKFNTYGELINGTIEEGTFNEDGKLIKGTRTHRKPGMEDVDERVVDPQYWDELVQVQECGTPSDSPKAPKRHQ